MRKEIIVLGDIEMGAGTITDDFISDKALCRLIDSLNKKKIVVDLILNGDTFDFIKCPILVNNQIVYPRHISPDISLKKMNLIIEAHSRVFISLKAFASHKKNNLYFIFGNHDLDLIFPIIQKELKNVLESKENVFFGMTYQQHSVYIEHGQQYDIFNRINLRRLFVKYHGKRILNLPWSFGALNKFMNIKEAHPFLERITPRLSLLSYYKPLEKKITLAAIKYFIASIFYYPFRYYSDPTYSFPSGIFGQLFRGLMGLRWEIDTIIDIFKKKKKRLLKRNKIVVLGHIHTTYVEEKKYYVLFHPGSWRDEYKLDVQNGKVTSKPKNYIHITVRDDKLSWDLEPITINRKTLDMRKIIEDEKEFIKKAAEEEGYYFRR